MSRLADAVRFLSMDAIERAQSGHPGAPMGMAEMAEVLWTRFLRHNPQNPHFYNRDRFVLSNGHASMLLYSLLHLSGYDVSSDDLKNFRQWGSKTPGHPELGRTPGVETTTGPLGQGFANAVGMALAEKILADEFNREGFPIVSHYTYAFAGDGCLMEGISHEAASLAGTLGLGKLIVLYDDNHISIDGDTAGWFSENIPQRFASYGWQSISVDGHDTDAIEQAILQAQSDAEHPTIICCRTIIGQGSAHKAGSHKVHGAPLGADEIKATRNALNWDCAPFEVPQDIRDAWDARQKGADLEQAWNDLFHQYRAQYPQLAEEFMRRMDKRLPVDFEAQTQAVLRQIVDQKATVATRKASQSSIAHLAKILPELIGGSADLTPSNLTDWPQAISCTREKGGNYIHYGVREFGMTAIVNGMTLHGGVRPFGATFLMFSEYARNALRMAALMEINPISVFTHDSIGLGEDGPTHQPVEQIASLRQIPNMNVWRPCDTVETWVAWVSAVRALKTPSALIFSRQNLPFVERENVEEIERGGYILRDAPDAKALIIATGSEVSLALKAAEQLAQENIIVRVVSMPCTRVFDAQSADYINRVLPRHLPKVAVEAGVRDYWMRYVGLEGKVVGIDHFGESAPADELFRRFNITTEAVIAAVKSVIA